MTRRRVGKSHAFGAARSKRWETDLSPSSMAPLGQSDAQRRSQRRWRRLASRSVRAYIRARWNGLNRIFRGSPFTLRRIMGEAAAGEVVVSRTVKDLVAGSGIEVDDAGEHFLKGIEQKWQLFRVSKRLNRYRS